jgi:RNA polymerase sigma factor (sigma-70 family)
MQAERLMQPTRTQRFEDLFHANYPAVRGYALRRTSREAAQDAVAETFLVAWRRLDDVPADPLPWLFGVARRVLANQRRAAGRSAALLRHIGATGIPAATAGPDEAVGEAELVRAALASLPERDREALMLVAWHGLSGARAARAAGCTTAAFGVRLHRARRRLAARLAAVEPGGPTTQAKSLEAS